MITELHIGGFKSFGSPPLRVELDKLNFLVGPNASGKTNFIMALRFLQNAIHQGVESAVNDLGGPSEVKSRFEHKGGREKHLTIKLHLDDQATVGSADSSQPYSLKGFDYSLSVDLRTSTDRPQIVEERLTTQVQQGESTSVYELQRDTKRVKLEDPVTPRRFDGEIAMPEQEAARPVVGVGFFGLPAVIFRETVQSWKFFNISPYVARQPYKALPDTSLGMYGENLAAVLRKIECSEEGNGIRALEASLRGAIPGFRGIKTVCDSLEGKWALQITEDHIHTINPTSISDGTVRLIALLTIATMATQRSSLIAIEEPENGLHPHLSEYLVHLFREASERSQLILTSHNPAFLDYLEPEEILLCDKVNGQTKMQKASQVAEIRKFQKHFSLGELWTQGKFDQLPEAEK